MRADKQRRYNLTARSYTLKGLNRNFLPIVFIPKYLDICHSIYSCRSARSQQL